MYILFLFFNWGIIDLYYCVLHTDSVFLQIKLKICYKIMAIIHYIVQYVFAAYLFYT